MLDLLGSLNKQEQQLIKLKETLESELHLISSREPETLMALLQDKEELLGAIEHLDKTIDKAYSAAKQNNELTDDIQDVVARCNKIVDECKYLTQINAKSVEQGQLRLTHMRNLMMELRARESMTYDRTGKTKGDASTGGFSA